MLLLAFCSFAAVAQLPVIIAGTLIPPPWNKAAHSSDPAFSIHDKKEGLLHVVWVPCDTIENAGKKDSSHIYYARSADAGRSWRSLCISRYSGNCSNGDSTLKGAVMFSNNKGVLCVVWAGPKGIMFQRSNNNGDSWLAEEKLIDPLKGGWQYEVDGVIMNGLPTVVIDTSKSEFNGRTYICWSSEKYGVKNKDVFLAYSDDYGDNFTEPILITYRPNHHAQFSPQMQLDNKGIVYVTYFDKQNYAFGPLTDVYVAVSRNGGLKFDYYQLNKKGFALSAEKGMYVNGVMFAQNTQGDIVTWPRINAQRKRVFNSGSSVFDSGSINEAALIENGSKALKRDSALMHAKTLAYAETIKLTFTLKEPGEVTAVITKPLEHELEKIIVKNKPFARGNNTLSINTKAIGLEKGNYVITLYYKGMNTFAWILED